MAQQPIADGLFTSTENGVRLIGGRRKHDGKIVFPMPKGAEAQNFDAVTLKDQGTLWSYTVQRFRPKSPYNADDDDRSFKPYALGYIELPGQVIVESRIEVDDFASLKIGQPMQLMLQPFRKAANGDDVVTFAFKPAA